MASETNNRTKIELEYSLRSSPQILFQYLSNPSGLQSWFADHVDIIGGIRYRFAWDDGTEYFAKVIKNIPNKYVRFQIEDAPENEFLEFRIEQDEITGDVELMITEFVDTNEVEMAASIWDVAVENLCSIIGA